MNALTDVVLHSKQVWWTAIHCEVVNVPVGYLQGGSVRSQLQWNYSGHHWDPAGCPVYSGTSL